MLTDNQEDNVEENSTISLGASFAIRGMNGFDPKRVSEYIGIQPSNSWKKGDEFPTKMLDVNTRMVIDTIRKRAFSVWRLDTDGTSLPKTVEAHLTYLLDLLEPVKERVAYYVNREDEYAVGFIIQRESKGNHGYTLSNKVITRIGSLCQYVSFSQLCLDDDEDE